MIVNNKSNLMERLNEVYNNPQNDDNTIIIRSLNSILNSEFHKLKYEGINYFVELFIELVKTSQIKRPDVEFIIEKIQTINANNTFNNFEKLLQNIYKQDMGDYKHIFVIWYCRTLFEKFYENKIGFTKPNYAIMKAMGDDNWAIFLKAFDKGDYAYMP